MMMKACSAPIHRNGRRFIFEIGYHGKGYIEKSDLESALGKVSQSGSTSSSSSTSADDMFSKMDSDGNGKVTKKKCRRLYKK